ncbi:hypothetical protein JTB14_013380 [Gonioctena quinquepunctata]|nr:hypothetical protein JTB14_013380 [Gonioctena quinquepunctata]
MLMAQSNTGKYEFEESDKLQLGMILRKSTKYSEKLSSTKGETKRSKQSSVSLEKGKQALEIEKRRQELEKESGRVQYELEEKKRQLEDDLKMLRMQEELQFAEEENTNESNSEDSREACSEISKHESVRKWVSTIPSNLFQDSVIEEHNSIGNKDIKLLCETISDVLKTVTYGKIREPASLMEETRPDWVPSINMGYEINHGNSHVCDRYKSFIWINWIWWSAEDLLTQGWNFSLHF